MIVDTLMVLITIKIDAKKQTMIDLAAYIMDSMHIVAAIKNDAIDIDPLIDVDEDHLIDTIKRFIKANALDGIVAKSKKGIKVIISKDKDYHPQASRLLTCPHCGKVSLYEEEMSVHIKAHYIGF